MPHRVQQKRTRGWRLPANTVSVARPGIWGNPYRVGEHGDAGECVARFRADCESGAILAIVRGHASARRRGLDASVAAWLAPLRGRNLACFCPLDQPCHADVLLALANHGETA